MILLSCTLSLQLLKFLLFYTKITASGQFLVLDIHNIPNKLPIIQSSKLNVLGIDTDKFAKDIKYNGQLTFSIKKIAEMIRVDLSF